MQIMIASIDWASKGLTLLVLLLAALFVTWQCIEGIAKITTIGRHFNHFIVNRRMFDRWLKELREKEEG
jgi:hypothetical protein